MTDVNLHPTPRWRDILLEQIRIVGLSLRVGAFLVAVVLGIGTILIGADIASGRLGFDSNETFPTALIAFLYPFAVWRDNKRFKPAFIWTLPVDRRRMMLATVLAGWVWFMAALIVFALWLLALVLIAGASPSLQLTRIPYAASFVMYLFGSALVVGLRHPLRWLLGTAGVVALFGFINKVFLGRATALDRLFHAVNLPAAMDDAARDLLSLPGGASFTFTTFVAVGAGLAALWTAVSRHKETR